MPTHTPGPWKATTTSKYVPAVVQDSTGKSVCLFDWRDLPRRTADARLISAAPELLDALALAYAELNKLGFTDSKITAARVKAQAAIAKARGEDQ